MNRRVLTLILVIVALGVVLTPLLLRPRAHLIKGPFYRVASNIQQASFVDDHLYFFTGSSFASLDINTGKTTRLSDYFYTTGQIVAGSWTSKSVVFSSVGTSLDDQFGKVLMRAGRDPSANSWWRYDFVSHRLAFLNFFGANTCTSITELGDNLYCFAPYLGSSHSYQLLVYNLANHELKEVLRTNDPVGAAQQDGTNIYYLTTNLDGSQNLVSYSDSIGQKVLYKSKRQLVYTANSQEILLDELPLTNHISVKIGLRNHLQEVAV